ncbi:hypothetical protein A676_00539 [Salmonella enterica subsp. enterica serovar Enteritidis str. 2010K-0262]|uniref:Uncharacterized protein n=2 Tax=Salmonella enterica I TaxID=59201 RepID=M7RF56_SALDU|nr:hypothetical protein A670_02806 [Salmonella enterica subsp. enterica serovar Dublin str. UC16]EPI69909.1 hypothetical protein A671_02481 [Salmonella enterica subsp. enterica serovar Dublin str. DG22]EPI74425.1 hypothetical protein A673_01157 [Salmonella enterica subsp. enterica serovar Enteritidis str. 2009K0958]EPI76949.1 hypothetical protein A672_00769 [Salmonella enterica subsp. enterica serovar Enteritidis str. 08-1080]EPI84831.1 hypothetical protein A674_03540 [Salmonella enterica subsp
MREIHIIGMVRTRTTGNNKFFCRQGFNRAVMAFQRQGMFVNKMGVALQYFTVVTLIKPLTHTRLLINHVIGMIKDVGERRTKETGVVAIERVLIKFNNAADGVAKGFGWDGAPVGTSAANVMITLNHRDACSLLNQTHCSAFTAGA